MFPIKFFSVENVLYPLGAPPWRLEKRAATENAVPIEDFIISVYCLVDDALNKMVITPLRSRGFPPKLSDAEVITMDIIGEFLGKDTDAGIWRYFYTHWLNLFSCLGSRVNYAKQSLRFLDLH